MIQVGKVEIYVRHSLPYISILDRPAPNWLTAEGQALIDDCFDVLLAGFGAILKPDDDLRPCFDIAEMQQRNRAAKRSPR